MRWARLERAGTVGKDGDGGDGWESLGKKCTVYKMRERCSWT